MTRQSMCSITNTDAITQWAAEYKNIVSEHNITAADTLFVDYFSSGLHYMHGILRPVCYFATNGDGVVYPFSCTYYNERSCYERDGEIERVRHCITFLKELGDYIVSRNQTKMILIPEAVYKTLFMYSDNELLDDLLDTITELMDDNVSIDH